jgi:hypothetical protein
LSSGAPGTAVLSLLHQQQAQIDGLKAEITTLRQATTVSPQGHRTDLFG